MSITTVLLLVGAIGIVLVMHFVGHGARSGTHGADVTSAQDPADGAGGAHKEPTHRRHGCC
jgi:hypothetical protein